MVGLVQVRTKPEDEADGGVCKGVAVLDSCVLTPPAEAEA